jgi:hypothetical protein
MRGHPITARVLGLALLAGAALGAFARFERPAREAERLPLEQILQRLPQRVLVIVLK